jgi:hypothetical protein
VAAADPEDLKMPEQDSPEQREDDTTAPDPAGRGDIPAGDTASKEDDEKSEAWKKGVEIGQREAAAEIAWAMLAGGFEKEFITEVTSASPETVDAYAATLQRLRADGLHERNPLIPELTADGPAALTDEELSRLRFEREVMEFDRVRAAERIAGKTWNDLVAEADREWRDLGLTTEIVIVIKSHTLADIREVRGGRYAVLPKRNAFERGALKSVELTPAERAKIKMTDEEHDWREFKLGVMYWDIARYTMHTYAEDLAECLRERFMRRVRDGSPAFRAAYLKMVNHYIAREIRRLPIGTSEGAKYSGLTEEEYDQVRLD